MDLFGGETVWVGQSADGGVERPATADWTVAAIAHAAACLTVVLGLASGIGLIIGPVVALAIHFVYRARSRFVALHALQSLAYQVAGAVSLSLARCRCRCSGRWARRGSRLPGVSAGFSRMPRLGSVYDCTPCRYRWSSWASS